MIFLEVASTVVTWWIVVFLRSARDRTLVACAGGVDVYGTGTGTSPGLVHA